MNSWSVFCTNKEQLEEARASAAEGKRSSASISERIQSLQGELSQSERRREELEAELKNTQEVKEILSTHLELNYLCLLTWRSYRIRIAFASSTVQTAVFPLCSSLTSFCSSAQPVSQRPSAAPSQLRWSGPPSRSDCGGCSEPLPCWRRRRKTQSDRL